MLQVNPCRGGETNSDNSYRTLVGRSKDAGTYRNLVPGLQQHEAEHGSYAGGVVGRQEGKNGGGTSDQQRSDGVLGRRDE